MVGAAGAVGSGAYVLGFAGVHRGPGVRRPRGGMSNLIEAFRGVLEFHGGQLRLGAPVAEIVVEGSRATGVRLEDGSFVGASLGVLSNLAPQVTFGRLMAPDKLTRAERNRVAMVPSNSINVAPFKIAAAMAGRVGYPVAEARRAKRDGADIRTATFMTGTLEDHIEQMYAMRLGLNVENPPVYMSVLSAADPTIAPDGGDVLYLNSNVPLDRKSTRLN